MKGKAIFWQKKRKSEIWSWPQRGAQRQDILTDWLTVSRKVTSTSDKEKANVEAD
jgi:hypothetical protein